MGRGHFDYEAHACLQFAMYKTHLDSAVAAGGGKISGYHDFPGTSSKADIDIVHIATPPHWHGIISKMAAEAGKDIWCEKR